MPTGQDSVQLANLPSIVLAPNTAAFNHRTRRKEATPMRFAAKGNVGGAHEAKTLPKSDMLATTRLVFDGSVTYDDGTGSITTSERWPHGLLKGAKFSANWLNSIIVANGEDLHVRRLAANPAFEDDSDVFPGTVGGGDDLAPGDEVTEKVYLTFELPHTIDPVTLAGLMFMQSEQNEFTVTLEESAVADLVTLTGDASWTLTGTWKVHVTLFSVPLAEDGAAIVPDLSIVHGFNAIDRPIVSTGTTEHPLIKSNGKLLRLFLQVRDTGDWGILSTAPADAGGWNSMKLRYGVAEEPLVYEPLGILRAINNTHYGATLPYGYVAVDFIREHAQRDAFYLAGVTEPRVVIDIDDAVVLDSAKLRIVAETAFT